MGYALYATLTSAAGDSALAPAFWVAVAMVGATYAVAGVVGILATFARGRGVGVGAVTPASRALRIAAGVLAAAPICAFVLALPPVEGLRQTFMSVLLGMYQTASLAGVLPLYALVAGIVLGAALLRDARWARSARLQREEQPVHPEVVVELRVKRGAELCALPHGHGA